MAHRLAPPLSRTFYFRTTHESTPLLLLTLDLRFRGADMPFLEAQPDYRRRSCIRMLDNTRNPWEPSRKILCTCKIHAKPVVVLLFRAKGIYCGGGGGLVGTSIHWTASEESLGSEASDSRNAISIIGWGKC